MYGKLITHSEDGDEATVLIGRATDNDVRTFLLHADGEWRHDTYVLRPKVRVLSKVLAVRFAREAPPVPCDRVFIDDGPDRYVIERDHNGGLKIRVMDSPNVEQMGLPYMDVRPLDAGAVSLHARRE